MSKQERAVEQDGLETKDLFVLNYIPAEIYRRMYGGMQNWMLDHGCGIEEIAKCRVYQHLVSAYYARVHKRVISIATTLYLANYSPNLIELGKTIGERMLNDHRQDVMGLGEAEVA